MMPEVNNEFGVSTADRMVFISGATPEETHKWCSAVAAASASAKALGKFLFII